MAAVILSAIGSDRPGLTEALAEAVLAGGGNWLESHLSQLGGLYVGSVLVDTPDGGLEQLRAALAGVDAHGLDVRLVSAGDQLERTGEPVHFAAVGQDRPGIVREITAVLSELGANIEAFDTRISTEAHSGARLFHIEAHVRTPPGTGAREVQAALEAISAEIMVDLSLLPTPAG